MNRYRVEVYAGPRKVWAERVVAPSAYAAKRTVRKKAEHAVADRPMDISHTTCRQEATCCN